MLYYIRLYFTSINRSPLWLCMCCVVPRYVTNLVSATECIHANVCKLSKTLKTRWDIAKTTSNPMENAVRDLASQVGPWLK